MFIQIHMRNIIHKIILRFSHQHVNPNFQSFEITSRRLKL